MDDKIEQFELHICHYFNKKETTEREMYHCHRCKQFYCCGRVRLATKFCDREGWYEEEMLDCPKGHFIGPKYNIQKEIQRI
jgi:hypothetical protein